MSEHREALDTLIDAGLTFGECVSAFAARNTDQENAYVAAAREHKHRDGDVEIDSNAICSGSSDDGDYVLAWVWIDDEDVEDEPLFKPENAGGLDARTEA